MSPQILYRLAGYCLFMATFAYLLDTFFDYVSPGNQYAIGILVPFFAIFGLTAHFLHQREAGGWFSFVAYALNASGLMGLIAVSFTNNLVLPFLEPAISGQLIKQVLLPYFIVIGGTYLCGALLFSVALWRSGNINIFLAISYGVTSIPVALPPLFSSSLVNLSGILLAFCLGLLGVSLIKQSSSAHITSTAV